MENIRDSFGIRLRKGFTPFISTLHRLGVTPNQITVAGTILNAGAAALIIADHLIWAGVVVLIAGICDMLDGSLARMAKLSTPFGAFFDSTFDRISEGFVLAAICYVFATQGHSVDAALATLALLGSLMVSYTRARAETLGLECKVGIMSRPERIILVAIGLFFNVLPYVIYIMLALTAFTVIQRVVHTYRELGRKRKQGGSVER